MAQLIRNLTYPVLTTDGGRFKAAVYGQPRSDGMWEGWLEFSPGTGYQPGTRLQTDRETVQASEAQLDYWAAGLEPAYLEGAFQRAHGVPLV
ncbi:MAG TPA: hypothetical protein VK009_20135 [Chloroflexota bacterium]|nr:hypothetical protein [Chloroflexota bacterium]